VKGSRLAVLQDLGEAKVRCLIAEDDESFTYNKRVNRLATVQEHFMILRALKSGVSESKLAKALNVDIDQIKRRKNLLRDICPEVVEIMKDKAVNPDTFDILRKMRPLRQIEAAELMESAANWTSNYAKALLAATKQQDLAKPDRPKRIAGMTPEQMARMERELDSLHHDFKQIENSYGDDILHLVIASGYLGKLVANREIEIFLRQRYPEFLNEFRSIIAATSLDQTGSAA
jgi:ParB-like chromosome segregation protein Spo0J